MLIGIVDASKPMSACEWAPLPLVLRLAFVRDIVYVLPCHA
jgi:hypothetical protein